MKEDTVNRGNITRHLIDLELEITGKTLLDIVDDDNWYFNITMTRNQFQQYKSSAIPLLKKTFKVSKRKAESIFGYHWKTYGVRIKN